MTPVSKGHKPKGARGMAAVKRLGRTKTTGNFNKIAQSAAKEYGSKVAGARVAGAIYARKTAAHAAAAMKSRK
ncbi:MAG TPA: hypothetical protein VKB38_13225 [Terracidiphilus sp.]|nr:hypothetical protein [Terracidiphilus sp.]